MKPFKIFIVFLGLLFLIAILAYIFPEQGVKLTKDIRLNFPSLSEIVEQKDVEYKDISAIVENNLPVDTMPARIDTAVTDTSQAKDTIASDEQQADTLRSESEKEQEVEEQARKRELSTQNKYLQYPGEDPSVLYSFFRNLNNLENNNQLIRILHYGDSQIEGDRISSYIRNQLQQRFGGSGIGLFPAVLPFNTHIPLKLSLSKSWERYTLKDKKNFPENAFGVLMSFSRFSPYYSNFQNEVYEASVNIKRSPLAYDRISKFTQCKIFYAFNEKPFVIKLSYHDQIADADIIPARRNLNVLNWSVPEDLNELTISFQGDHSPNIYGIALDGKQGVALDNIPLRGSRGTDFTKTDTRFYKNMLQELNVKLIILHFGVNVVPVIRDDYSFYEEQFYKQLTTLKSLDEDLSIIVMGVTDMSRKAEGSYESYPNIEKIRDAQKSAAFRAGCAFWDTYQAMGGKNSMPSWVFADPPLARKDFTHFTYKGSVVIAKMFYKALMRDFIKFQELKNSEMLSEKSDST
jgi:hypothetical protein